MDPKTARDTSDILRVTNDIIRAKVINQEGEEIGAINEVLIDFASGRMTYAILSFGGFLGLGDKLFAVPWMSLSYDPSRKAFTMKANKDLLKNAPGFDKDRWPEMADPTRLSEIYKHYASKSYWRDERIRQ